MSLTRKIAHNTLIQILGKALGLSLSVLTLGIMTRYLGPELFGYYTTAFAFLQIFGILIDFGLQMITVQLISDPGVDESKMFSNIFTFRIFSALLFFFVPYAALFFPYPHAIKIGVVITSFTYFFTTISSVALGIFQKHFKMKYAAWADFFNKFLLFALTFAMVALQKSIVWFFLAAAASNGAYLLLLLLFAKKITPIKILIEWDKWKLILSRAWPLALSILFNLIYFKADTVILSLFRSQTEVGLYGAPYKILEVLINFSYLFLGLLLPLMAFAYANKNSEDLRRYLQNGFDVMAAYSLPLVFGTAVLGKEIMGFVAGQAYAPSGDILKILMVAVAIISLTAVFGYGIVATNIQKKILPYFALNAAVSLALYFIFIPKYSYWAAAWTTVYTEIFILISSLVILYKKIKFLPRLKIFLKSLFASLIMSLALVAAKKFNFASGIYLMASVSFSSVIYLLALYALGGISKKMVLDIFSVKKN